MSVAELERNDAGAAGKSRYRIVDARHGLVERGELDIQELLARDPWPS